MTFKLYPPGTGLDFNIPPGIDCRLPAVPDPSTPLLLHCRPLFLAAGCGDPSVQGFLEGEVSHHDYASACTGGPAASCSNDTPQPDPALWWDTPVQTSTCGAAAPGTGAMRWVCEAKFTGTGPTRCRG